jgi:glycine cleavage system aminomethyltransferase T
LLPQTVVADAAALGGEPVVSKDEVVGHVTSANFGYTVGESLAYAYLPPGLASPGTKVELDLRGDLVGAIVRDEPAFDPRGERLRA